MPTPPLAYQPPVSEILEALDLVGLADTLELPQFAHVDREMVGEVLHEFGRFAAEVIAPTDRLFDLEGATLTGSAAVSVPHAVARAFGQFVDAGWGAVAGPAEYGGGGFPPAVGMAIHEMFTSANMALSLNPLLTQTVIELLATRGSEDQRARLLPGLVSGRWAGTMILTEPQAGSDVGGIRSIATPLGEGHWSLSGTKIFITWGEHDLGENIVHVVLARTPGAPAGTEGLSLFIVPKFRLDARGDMGERNSLRCARLESKLGIHGSPTCEMAFEGAEAELLGEEHGGMRAMFTMMNSARLGVGMQGPSVAERAYQQALDYASTREQGRSRGTPPTAVSPILGHPDVRRMLLSMRTTTIAGRLMVYLASHHREMARFGTSEAQRSADLAMTDLLTPIAKAWPTDAGVAAASLGIQVLGGTGYIEETGMAQRLRDARISPIYEGTNGIQAIDLVMRKLPGCEPSLRRLLDDMEQAAAAPAEGLDETRACLDEALSAVRRVSAGLLAMVRERPVDALAGASAYLEMVGTTLAGWLMLRRATRHGDQDRGGDAATESEFFATEHLARVVGLVRPVLAGAERLGGLAGPAT